MDELLFKNIGGRIKTVAKVTAYIEMGSALLGGVIMFFTALSDMEDLWYLLFLTPVIVVVGILMAWLSVIVLYGFGELIETNSEIRDNTAFLARQALEQKNKEQPASQSAPQTAQRTAYQSPYQPTPRPYHQPAPQGYPAYNNTPRPATPAAPAAPSAQDPLAEKLAFALRYQTDEGMIHYLEQLPDERVKQILKNPRDRVRDIVRRVLETM